jgi:hypothetical protein
MWSQEAFVASMDVPADRPVAVPAAPAAIVKPTYVTWLRPASGGERHALAVGDTNPGDCTPDHACAEHQVDHEHGQDCGHEAVPHDGHVDYLVGGHLDHPTATIATTTAPSK